MFNVLLAGLEFSDSRIPKWMTFKDRDHLSAQDKNRHVVSACGSANACSCRTSLTDVSELESEPKLI